MHLPRKLTVLLLAAALPLGFAACAPDADDRLDEDTGIPAETPEPAPAPGTTDLDMQPMTGSFAPLGESNIAGTIEVDDEGQQTKIHVRLTGAPPNAVLQGHVHAGTCEAVGDVVVPLEAVEVGDDGIGESESTVAIAPMTAFDGQHIVAFHEPGGSPGRPVTCAVIPAHTM
jgi:hypothetical protein